MPASNPSAFVNVLGRRLEYRRIAASADGPTMVFLHEGLGSIGQWRDFPTASRMPGLPAIVYARYGHGRPMCCNGRTASISCIARRSNPCPNCCVASSASERRSSGRATADGASIALIYAGSGHPLRRAWWRWRRTFFVEDISIAGITAAKQAFETTDLPQKLARHHRDARKTFYGWNEVWLAPAFRSWNIEAFLPAIKCPLLAIQGYGDEYGTMAQVDCDRAPGERAGPEVLKLEDCGHSPTQGSGGKGPRPG